MKRLFNSFAFKCGLLILFAAAVYAPVIKADFVKIDDSWWITKNQLLRDASGLKKIWFEPMASPLYCPMVLTAFWVQYHLWGLDPEGYHSVNVLFHTASAILLLLILMRLSVPGALLTSLIFLIHPAQVESLAWAAELKNILSGFFSLASVWAFLRFNPPEENQSEQSPLRYYLISLFLFVCALLSKPTVATTAPALLVVYWWKRGRITLRDVLLIAPMFILGVAMGIAITKLEGSLNMLEGIKAVSQISAAPGSSFTIVERCLIAGHAIWFYTSKLLWPIHLTCFYTAWEINPTSWRQYIYPATAIAAIVLLWSFRKKIGLGPISAVLIFAGTLAPVLGFIDYATMADTFVQDHFVYMACISFIALLSASGAVLFRRLGPRFERVKQASIALVIISLSLLSFRQGNFYRRNEFLRINHIRICPDSPIAQISMGDTMLQKGNLDKAILYIQEAIRLRPDYGEAHNDMGVLLMNQGKFEEAIPHFYKSIETNPIQLAVHFNLGYALARTGKLDEAIAEFNNGLTLVPENAKARYSLGNLYMLKGNFDAAIQQFREALRINPNYVEASNSLKYALEKKNGQQGTR